VKSCCAEGFLGMAVLFLREKVPVNAVLARADLRRRQKTT